MKQWHVPAGANATMIGKRYLDREPIVLAIWMANLVACNSVGHSGTTTSVVAAVDANSLDGSASGAATVDANSLDGCVSDFTTIDANSLFGPSDAADGACATAQDCYNTRSSDTETLFCCIEGTCAYSEGTDILPCTDANVQLIQASNYDQSCRTASDCILVAEGNFCQSAGCPNAAINISAYARYQADVAKTNAAICGGITSCLGLAGVCCQNGVCQVR
jgi:hypothetical protein